MVKKEFKAPKLRTIDIQQTTPLANSGGGLASNGPSATYMSNPTVNTAMDSEEIAWN